MDITNSDPISGVPLVTVVVPCYNYGHFLHDALQSVQEQTWQHWECIVIDDGSTDSTSAVVKAFQRQDSRFKYVYQPNQGLSAARNTGLAAASGSYVQLLDADDGIERQKLELHVDYLEQHPDVDLVYGDVLYAKDENLTYSEDISNRRKRAPVSGSGEDMLHFLVRRNIMVVNAPLARIKAIHDVGKFNEKLKGHEDWEFWIRCAFAGKRFVYAGGAGTHAVVRVHRKSMTQSVMPMLESNLAVRYQLRALPLPRQLHRQNNFRIGLHLVRAAKTTASNGNFNTAINYAASAVWAVRRDWRIILVLAFLFVPQSVASRLVIALDSAARKIRGGNQDLASKRG